MNPALGCHLRIGEVHLAELVLQIVFLRGAETVELLVLVVIREIIGNEVVRHVGNRLHNLPRFHVVVVELRVIHSVIVVQTGIEEPVVVAVHDSVAVGIEIRALRERRELEPFGLARE